MEFIKKNFKGLLLCLAISVPSYFLGKKFSIIGGPVFAILIGMVLALIIKNKQPFESGIKFTSKKILQYAIIFLGFGMNLEVVMETGKQSLPIILCTITTSLLIAFILHKVLHIPTKISTLIGVGSSICGGSAIAATAPVIDADDEEVAQSISVIFLFNILAALIFPALGTAFLRTKKEKSKSGEKVSVKHVFPFFILYFIGASIITTIAVSLGVPSEFFTPMKDISKFLIIMAMAAIGFNTDIVKLVKSGGKPIIMGMSCWVGITAVTLTLQHLMKIW